MSISGWKAFSCKKHNKTGVAPGGKCPACAEKKKKRIVLLDIYRSV